MNVDSDIQTWLEVQHHTPPAIVAFVKSYASRRLDYKIQASVVGIRGESRITQGGSVETSAHSPTVISRISLHYSKQDICSIDIRLSENGKEKAHERFKCP
jgi:hypothetical protein